MPTGTNRRTLTPFWQRQFDRADDTFRAEFALHPPFGQAMLDQIAAEPRLARGLHAWAALLGPHQAENARPSSIEQLPAYRDLAPGPAERPVLGGVGRKLMQKQSERGRCLRRQLHAWTVDMNPGRNLVEMRSKLLAGKSAELGAA